MIFKTFLSGLALTLVAGQASAIAVAPQIVFEDAYEFNAQAIEKTFGSIAGQLDTLLEANNGGNLLFWTEGYSGRPAAYSGTGIGSITLTPRGGYSVTLLSFFLGAWRNSDRTISYVIDDLATPGVDISFPDAPVSGTSGRTVNLDMTSAAGIRITFGPDGFNGGINNITYSLQPVPEPGTWAMLGVGLGVLGFGLRRSRR